MCTLKWPFLLKPPHWNSSTVFEIPIQSGQGLPACFPPVLRICWRIFHIDERNLTHTSASGTWRDGNSDSMAGHWDSFGPPPPGTDRGRCFRQKQSPLLLPHDLQAVQSTVSLSWYQWEFSRCNWCPLLLIPAGQLLCTSLLRGFHPSRIPWET